MLKVLKEIRVIKATMVHKEMTEPQDHKEQQVHKVLQEIKEI